MTYQTPSRSAVGAFLLKPEKQVSSTEAQAFETKSMAKKAEKKSVKQEVTVVPETSEEENEALV
jgi:hypothetical protein